MSQEEKGNTILEDKAEFIDEEKDTLSEGAELEKEGIMDKERKITSEPVPKKRSRFSYKSDNKENYFIYENDIVKKKGDKPFAAGLTFYKLFWVFFIGCIVGVIVETLFCLVMEHKIESRQGLIYGPFNPVYGFGAVVITAVLYFMRNARDLWVFVAGAILGGAFEYICSWYQETFLGTLSWDYSGDMGSIGGGRTSLIYMLFWGILTIIWLKFIYPFMSRCIEKIPKAIGTTLTWVLVVFMVLNMLVSGMAVYRMNMRHSGVPAKTWISQKLDQLYTDEFLQKIYPNMKITNPKDGK